MKILLIAIILLTTQIAYADKLILPVSHVSKELRQHFEDNNLKIDKDPDDKTEDSFGFIIYESGNACIYTYKPITTEQLNHVTKIIFGER